MAIDENLAERARQILGPRADVVEQRMFGGLAFLVNGHMCCGIVGDELMVRVGPDAHERALTLKHARPMDFTGRPLKGMVYVSRDGIASKRTLSRWIERGLEFVEALPAKQAKKKKRRR